MTDDIIEDMETTQNYKHPVDKMLIEPTPVCLQQLVVPLPVMHPEAPATDAPSTSNTPNVTIQRKRTNERSPSSERKKRHTRGEKRLPSENILVGGRKQ